MRLKGKVGIVVGAGQTPGDTFGNGRAAAVLFAREGAKVLLVDRELKRAEETPMAIEGQAKGLNIRTSELRAERDKRVPLKNKMGSAWDVAHAALFLHSDESAFITGVALPVDGGQSARIG